MFFSIEVHSPCLTIRLGRWEASAWSKAQPHYPGKDCDLWTLKTYRGRSGGFCEAVLLLPLVALCWTDTTA